MAYWEIDLINTNTKILRLEPTLYRNAVTLKLIITKYIKQGKIIILDGWMGNLDYLLIILDMYI